MKILHLSQTDMGGGAFMATYRLHHALLRAGVDSCLLVEKKNTCESQVLLASNKFTILRSMLTRFLSIMLAIMDFPNKSSHTLNILPSQIINHINDIRPDLVHIHWVGGEFLPLQEIKNIKFPIVWTFHDLWPILGVYHYENNMRANILMSWIDHFNFGRKKKYLSNLKNTVLVCPSNWMADTVKSSFLSAIPREVIPNCVDEQIYKPYTRKVAKKNLSLSERKIFILFGASSKNDPRKGFSHFLKSIEIVLENSEIKSKIQIGVFGSGDCSQKKILDVEIIDFGYISNEKKMATILSAADLCVFPSMLDNLPSILIESLLCGTPIIAYDNGGIRDLITHKQTGYLAKSGNIQELANGINWYFSLTNKKILKIRKNCRNFALHRFSMNIIAIRHINLYKSLLKK